VIRGHEGDRAAVVAVLLAAGMISASCARETAPGADRGVSAAPTFTKDVAPILFEHCFACHRAGQSAPFPLTTYAEAQPRARAIADAIGSRRMPPWLPAHGQPPMVGERRLPDRAVHILEAWATGGALEGDAADLPARPAAEAAWQLGIPDLVATVPEPYRLEPGAHDVFRNLVFRLPASETRFVRALEFQPAGAPVHHAIIRIDRARSSRARDGVDGKPGFDGMAAGEVQDPDGAFLGWAPGRGPISAPDDLPWILPRGSDLVVELHLMPAPTPTDVRPSIGLFFTDRAPSATPVLVVLGSKAIDIPAGATDYAIEDRFELPVDAELRSVYPHAHYLGKTMDVRAMLPDGTSRQVLSIQRWSFNWQQDYRLVTPMPLPRGTTLAMRFTYDNSAANRHNPSSPPQRVTWGQNSHDEMGNVGVQLVTRTAADATRLNAVFAQHAAQIDVAGAEMLVRAYPANASHAALLGTALARAGRLSEAVPALERAIALDRASASLENFLGGALLGLGRGAEALVHFQAAAALAPRDPRLRFNLARVLSAAGRHREAIREYSVALSLDPDFVEAHQELGVVYFTANRLSDALVHLRRATELAPGSATAHSAYGGALAQAGRRVEAMAELERALQLDPSNEAARENLARLRPPVPR
jgi:Flp pilus assembly protein TadD